MIQYDPHRWFDHFFDIRGSLVREIAVRVTLCVAWSFLVVLVHKRVHPIGMPSLLHTLIGFALSLLLVFRTNAAYDRFWEGRRLWGSIVNATRNLARSASVYLAAVPDVLSELAHWTAVFPWAAMNTLRSEPGLGPFAGALPSDRVREVAAAQHPALAVTVEMSRCLREAARRGNVSDFVLVSLEQHIQQLVDCLGGCERIRRTPLPFAYVVHLRRALVLYTFTLPFALVETFGWATVPDVFVIGYVFYGIEEIGVEIEGPFGHDDNDLPLEEICGTIHRNVYSIAGIERLAPEAMPTEL